MSNEHIFGKRALKSKKTPRAHFCVPKGATGIIYIYIYESLNDILDIQGLATARTQTKGNQPMTCRKAGRKNVINSRTVSKQYDLNTSSTKTIYADRLALFLVPSKPNVRVEGCSCELRLLAHMQVTYNHVNLENWRNGGFEGFWQQAQAIEGLAPKDLSSTGYNGKVSIYMPSPVPLGQS